MAKAEGITCPTCGMTRAPTLADCPRCRAAPAPTHDDLGERALLADEPGQGDLASLPSRLFLAGVPLLGLVAMFVLPGIGGRAVGLGYSSLGWVSTAVALLAATLVAIVGTRFLVGLARRISIGGQSASPLAIAAFMIFGVGPFVAVPIYGGLEAANTRGLDPGAAMDAECRWTEARQQVSERTGAVVHVTVHAVCTLPDGSGLEVDVPLEAASLVDGERLVVPVLRGRFYGRLVAPSGIRFLSAR